MRFVKTAFEFSENSKRPLDYFPTIKITLPSLFQRETNGVSSDPNLFR